jgi:hypothetical protein
MIYFGAKGPSYHRKSGAQGKTSSVGMDRVEVIRPGTNGLNNNRLTILERI